MNFTTFGSHEQGTLDQMAALIEHGDVFDAAFLRPVEAEKRRYGRHLRQWFRR